MLSVSDLKAHKQSQPAQLAQFVEHRSVHPRVTHLVPEWGRQFLCTLHLIVVPELWFSWGSSQLLAENLNSTVLIPQKMPKLESIGLIPWNTG